jgi:hypothetical protein
MTVVGEPEKVNAWGERGLEIVRRIVEREGLGMPRAAFLLATRDLETGEPFESPVTAATYEQGQPAPAADYIAALVATVAKMDALAIVIVIIDRTAGRVGYFFWPVTAPGVFSRRWEADATQARGVTVCGPFRETEISDEEVTMWIDRITWEPPS